MRSSFQLLGLAALCAGTSFCAQSQISQSQTAPLPRPATKAPAKLPLRVLIVSGGPSPDYNQYAIESNARYLEKLTAGAKSQRVLFADGRKTSRTISALPPAKSQRTERVLDWLFDLDAPSQNATYRAPTLKRIDGPSNKKTVLAEVETLARGARAGESSLLYFTGHGGQGRKMRFTILGPRAEADSENTTYALWNNDEVDVKTLAKSLEKWPSDAPLVLIMVQCHAGGFANLMFEGGAPKGVFIKRNFAGFFAATGERQASGCTSEVDEVDYQDFTTHFFAALSGTTRDGRQISGADWDKNGAVSMLEALAWTNLHDDSIDVPLCTSDAYLRSIWPVEVAPEWVKTPYSRLIQNAAPWQRATLDGLSGPLKLRGENRVQSALAGRASAARQMEEGASSSGALPASLDADATWGRYYTTKAELKSRFPGLSAPQNSARFQTAHRGVLRYLESRPADLAALARVLELWGAQGETAPTREAQGDRFIRAARTLFLERKLETEGTPTQKLIFSRLRSAENRNPLR